MIGSSIGVTHGTATSTKRIGNEKCRSQVFPPIDQRKTSVIVTTQIACSQLNGRQSGLPISKSRIGNKSASAVIAIAIAIVRAFGFFVLRSSLFGLWA